METGFPPKTQAGKDRHARIVKMHVEEKKQPWETVQELHIGESHTRQILKFYCGIKPDATKMKGG